jgi:uncharacterized membrane protein
VRIWDFLFALFVLFPIVTGGFWHRSESLKIEYTQPGVAAAILFLWAFIAWKKGKDPLGKSFFLQFFHQAWHRWQNITANSRLPLVTGWLFVSLLWFLSAWSRHRGFQTHAADLGIFTNGIWNISQTGSPYSSIKGGISLLADHQDFLIYPLAALFSLLPHPATLLAIQALALASGGIALYLLARQRLGRSSLVPALLPLIYWACTSIRSANLFDFHPEVLMLPLFLFGAWGVQSPRRWEKILGSLLFLTALAAKESAGPVACGLGLAWVLGAGPENTRSYSRAFGGIAILLGIGIFLFDTKAIPQLLGVTYAYGDVYAPLGSSLLDLVQAPFTHSQEFFSRVFGISRLKFLFKLLLPFLFLPLLSWPGMVAALPGFLMLFLTAGDQRLSGFHYAIEPITGLLFALPAAFQTRFARKYHAAILLLLPLAALLQFGRSEIFHWRFYSIEPRQAWARDHLLPAIHPLRSVSANSALVPHLSIRRWVHFLPVVVTEEGKPVECLIWDRALNQTPMNAQQITELEARVQSPNYELEFACGSLTVHKIRGGESCLSGPLACPP